MIANSYFRQDKYKESSIEYEKALELFLSVNKDLLTLLEQTNYQNLIIESYNNLCICKLKLKEYNEVISITNKVFSFSKFNFKALCYRAKALYYLGQYKECIVYAKSAISLQPNQIMTQLIQASEAKIEEEYKEVKTVRTIRLNSIDTNTEEKPKISLFKVLKLFILMFYDMIKKNKLPFTLIIGMIYYFTKKKLVIRYFTYLKDIVKEILF